MSDEITAYEQRLRRQLAKVEQEITSKEGSRNRILAKLKDLAYSFENEQKRAKKKVSKVEVASQPKETKTVLKKKVSEAPAAAASGQEDEGPQKKKGWSLSPFN